MTLLYDGILTLLLHWYKPIWCFVRYFTKYGSVINFTEIIIKSLIERSGQTSLKIIDL